MAHKERQNKGTLNKYIQVRADTHTRITLGSQCLHPSTLQCTVKSLTPAVVVSWFKGSVITNGDTLACECKQHSLGVGEELG